jgi:imidazolonepropionase-like amidohydrolase
MMLKLVLFAILLFFTTLLSAQDIILQHVNLIDGSGSVKINQDIHIRAGKIIDVRHHRVQKQPSVQYISLKGKTMMPLLIDAHCHVGILKGTKVIPENYTAENIERQLHKYLQYGVGAVMSLGTDRKSVIPIRAASQRGEIEGATLYSAISGFGSEALPPANMSPEVLRPKSVAEAVKNVQDLTDLKPDMIKIWVEGSPKMKPEIYTAIIQEAHRHQIRVAAHVYQLEDARNLVKAGVDVIAHSIRDKEIDDELLKLMKQKAVVYIPTLTLDYYNLILFLKLLWSRVSKICLPRPNCKS